MFGLIGSCFEYSDKSEDKCTWIGYFIVRVSLQYFYIKYTYYFCNSYISFCLDFIPSTFNFLLWARKRIHWAKALVSKLIDLSLIPGTHILEEENQLLQTVLGLPRFCTVACTHAPCTSHTHV